MEKDLSKEQRELLEKYNVKPYQNEGFWLMEKERDYEGEAFGYAKEISHERIVNEVDLEDLLMNYDMLLERALDAREYRLKNQ